MDNGQQDVVKHGHILIVDDKLHNLRLLSRMLEEYGYHVQAVTEGTQALEAVRQSPPDLILLDIMMPKMDGYEVCRRLKTDPQTCEIPIIFISALDHTQDKVQALDVGGVDYITKPFKVKEVLARVKTHLSVRNLQRQLKQTNAELADHVAELAQANAALEARNEELDAFAHTVAHDLKNPLALLMGYADLLARETNALSRDELQLSARNMLRGAHKMRDIINSLLLLTSARKMDVPRQPLDMGEIVAAALERLETMAERCHAEIQVPEAWPVAMGYAPWVEEVWVNYISNALKYGGQSAEEIPPRVELGACPLTDEEQPTLIRFWVRDNGPGLTEEEQARLFVPFERLGRVRVEGHGLGLSIVRRIVEKLAGHVDIESEPGKGSVFSFTLRAAAHPPERPRSGDLRPSKMELTPRRKKCL